MIRYHYSDYDVVTKIDKSQDIIQSNKSQQDKNIILERLHKILSVYTVFEFQKDIQNDEKPKSLKHSSILRRFEQITQFADSFGYILESDNSLVAIDGDLLYRQYSIREPVHSYECVATILNNMILHGSVEKYSERMIELGKFSFFSNNK